MTDDHAFLLYDSIYDVGHKKGFGKGSKRRSAAAKKAGRTRKRNAAKKTSQKAGKDAHRKTIGPSHRKCQEFLQEKRPSMIVTPPTGRPDFVVHKKAEYYELKPVTGADDRKYLSEPQKDAVKKLLNFKTPVYIVYYKKSREDGKDIFRFSEVRLSKRNVAMYCYSKKNKKKLKDLSKIKFPEKSY
jgi:endo-alpha-1,4-polygalactosaminidase (GH114 family)